MKLADMKEHHAMRGLPDPGEGNRKRAEYEQMIRDDVTRRQLEHKQLLESWTVTEAPSKTTGSLETDMEVEEDFNLVEMGTPRRKQRSSQAFSSKSRR